MTSYSVDTETALLGVHVPARGVFPVGVLVPVFIDGKPYGYPGRELIKFGRVIGNDGAGFIHVKHDLGFSWITENLAAKRWREYLTSPRFDIDRETWHDVGVNLMTLIPAAIRGELTEIGEN